MSGITSYAQTQILNATLATGAGYAVPTSLWVGLFTSLPSETTGGTEVYSGQYRQSVTFNAAGGTPISVYNSESFVITSTSAWGSSNVVCEAFGIFDALTGGNLWFFGPLSQTRTLVPANGDSITFPLDSITINIG